MNEENDRPNLKNYRVSVTASVAENFLLAWNEILLRVTWTVVQSEREDPLLARHQSVTILRARNNNQSNFHQWVSYCH